MTTVLAAGVFDFFHPGHRYFLNAARQLGDRLVVIVARDKNVFKLKGYHPSQDENQRKIAVERSNIASEVILGEEHGDFLAIVSRISPDILALGYDQKLPEGLTVAFPDLQIITLPALNPHKWKSTHIRKKTLQS